MTEQPAVPEPSGELLALARERQFDELERAWMKRLEDGPRDSEELYVLAEYLVRKKFSEQAALLLWSLVAAVSEKTDPRSALQVAVRAAGIAPDAPSLREEVVALYQKAAGDIPELPVIIEAFGIGRRADVNEAVRRIEQCLKFRPGAFVTHARSRRMGRIKGFEDGAYLIESDRAVQSLVPAEAVAQWEPAEPDDFRALAAFEPDRLRRMAAEDPVGLVQRVLRTCSGRADFKQFKFMLIPAAIPAENWSAWWNGVKVLLKRSPTIEVGEGTQPPLALRSAETNYADSFRAAFDAAADPFEKIRQVMTYLAEVDAGHEGDVELAGRLGGELVRIGRETPRLAEAVAVLTAAAELHAKFPSAPDPHEALARKSAEVTDAAALLSNIPAEEVARAVLATLKTVLPERWPDLFAQAFAAATFRLCDAIARELTRAGRDDLLRAAVRRAISAPDQSGESFGWSWRWLFSSDGAADETLDRVSVTVTLLNVVNRLARVPRHTEKHAESRQLLSKFRGLIAAGDCKLVQGVVAASSVAEARLLHEAILANEGLTGEVRQGLLGALRDKHPHEFAEKKNLWEDGNIYVTAEGLARQQAEMEKLVNVDMPRNAQAIGKAAAMGDLRENWEYKSALEERDRLVERAARMRAELDRARAIQPAMVSGNEVNIGTRVRLRDVSSGRERTVAFLGPWDADIPRGVYSYLAPMSLGFMGKKVGERGRATLDDVESEFEIVTIDKVV